MKIMEIVEFKLNEGANKQEFKEKAQLLNDHFLKNREGFIHRHLVEQDDTWMDIILWENQTAAQKAGKEVMKAEACAPFMSMINPETVTMKHNTVQNIYAQ